MWIDRGIIDGTLHLIGRTALRLGEIFRNDFDLPVVNGFGDLVGESVKRFGRAFRMIQTGKVQQYLLVLMAIIVVLGAVLLLPGLRPRHGRLLLTNNLLSLILFTPVSAAADCAADALVIN